MALFRATTVRRVIPSKPSPHNGSLALFRGSFASLQLSTNVLKRVALRLIAVSFLNSHEYTQLLDSPNDYELPFHEPKSASWSSWAPCDRTISFRQLRLLRSVFPPASPFCTDEVIHPADRRNSLGLLPLQSSTAHTSGSRTRPGLTA